MRVRLANALFPYPAVTAEFLSRIDEFITAGAADPGLARIVRDHRDTAERVLRARTRLIRAIALDDSTDIRSERNRIMRGDDDVAGRELQRVPAAASVGLGGYEYGGTINQIWHGWIGDVRIVNRPLSVGEFMIAGR